MVALIGKGSGLGWLWENWVEHLIITHLVEHECGSVGLGMGLDTKSYNKMSREALHVEKSKFTT